MKFPCDLCSATEQLPLPGDPSGKIGICRGCGFVYVSERRSMEEVANAWTDIYRNGGYDPDWPGVRARLFYVAEWLDSHIGLAGKSVLDIGAGNGFFLDCARNHGAITTGLDPDVDNVKKIRSAHYAVQGYASDEAMALDEFDIVTLNWTLENTADCMSVLRYAKRSLKPDGVIAVATGSRIGVPYKKPLQDYIPQALDYPHDTHCFRWSRASLSQAADKIGMTLLQINDFVQRDELIVVIGHSNVGGIWEDSAEKIFNHFTDWRRSFP